MNKYEENLGSLCIGNKEFKGKYFTNGEIIQKIFDVVRRHFVLNDSLFGNYASHTMIIINSSKANIIVEKIKDFYDENNEDFYDIYLTTYEKTVNKQINETLLQKEVQIIKPSKVLYLGFDFDYPILALSKTDLDLLISNVESLNNVEIPKYKRVNKKFISLLKYVVEKESGSNME